MFTSDFINKCVKDGKKTPAEICEEAESKIVEIDKIKSKIEALSTIQSKLRIVLRHIGGDKYKRRRALPTASIENSISIDHIESMSIAVCDFIDKQKKGVNVRSIMDAVGGKEKNSEVYHCIKTLEEAGVIKREDKNYEPLLFKGPAWNDRKKLEKTKKKSN